MTLSSTASKFELEKAKRIAALGADAGLRARSVEWIAAASRHKYSHNFTWLGVPIIQFPQDILAMQEIIWRIRPALIVETGIAHGGGLIFYASMLELIGGGGIALGIENDMREDNFKALYASCVRERIEMIQGSSTDASIVARVHRRCQGVGRVLLVLDSHHAHQHVLTELKEYSSLVHCGSYIIVCDTIIEDLPAGYFADRPWDKGNNPKTAVREFLRDNDRFRVDEKIDNKLLISCAPGGYLKCVKD